MNEHYEFWRESVLVDMEYHLDPWQWQQRFTGRLGKWFYTDWRHVYDQVKHSCADPIPLGLIVNLD